MQAAGSFVGKSWQELTKAEAPASVGGEVQLDAGAWSVIAAATGESSGVLLCVWIG